MAIPDYQTIMLPLLKFAGDGKDYSKRQAIDTLADEFDLTEAERREMLPSGRQPLFENRLGWARTYLKKSGLIEPTRRGYFRITPRGLGIIKQNPPKIDVKFLDQFEEFKEFRVLRHEKSVVSEEAEAKEEENPEELLESAYQSLRKSLASDLLQQIKQSPPSLFERVVVELLVKMGYGGSRKDAGQAIGKSGDEGIDGIIKEDRLGLDTIYIQAKKWGNTVVGGPEIQKFAGALQVKHARKGIFITSSSFSQKAREHVSHIDVKIILIDGETLAELMIDHNIGVTPISVYEVKKVDLDYFTEE